jgi:galactokinase
VSWFVPGRIEVLGKHTDYAGGRSLLAAVDRGVTVHVEPSTAPDITASSTASPGEIHIHAGSEPNLPAGHWGRYVQAVVDRLSENFGPLAPARLTVESTLPLASGMSSSSALVVALAMSLADANGFTDTALWREAITDRVDLAGYMACYENGMSFKNLAGRRGVGTFGGSEDHTAMLCCSSDQLTQFSFCPIRSEGSVPFPSDHTLVVAVSGVAAEKTGAARDLYNRASLATQEIVARWNAAHPSSQPAVVIADIVGDRGDERLEAELRALVADGGYLAPRLNQFLEESNRIIPAASQALADGDLAAFGAAVDASMALTTSDLGNQVPETVALATDARELGAVAASAFGAGFGGSVWAMVPSVGADDFAGMWLERYARAYPAAAEDASTLLTRPADAAHTL